MIVWILTIVALLGIYFLSAEELEPGVDDAGDAESRQVSRQRRRMERKRQANLRKRARRRGTREGT